MVYLEVTYRQRQPAVQVAPVVLETAVFRTSE